MNSNNNNYNNFNQSPTALTPAFVNKIASMCYGSYYINNVGEDAFYKHIPEALSPIYKQAVLWHQWSSSGFVPTFHEGRNGIIQTNIGVCLTDTISRILGGRIFCRSTNNQLKDIVSQANLDNVVNQAISYAVKDGTAMVKADVDESGNITFNAYPLNRFIASVVDAKGNVRKARFFIDVFESDREGTYWLVEKRTPKTVKYYITKDDGSGGKPKHVSYLDLGEKGKRWIDSYEGIKLDEELPLPFEDAGCYLLKVRNLAYNPMSPYGESYLQPVLNDLYEYEYAESGKIVDMYTGRARIMVSQQYANQGFGVSGLDSFMYLVAPDSSIDSAKPSSVQFDYRTDEHIKMKEEILETMAAKIGISGVSLATFLKSQGVKTATEVNAETDLTANFAAGVRRTFIIPFINKLVDTLIKFYHIPLADYTISLPTSGFSSSAVRNSQAIALYQAGLASIEQALKIIYPDADASSIKEMADAIKSERSEVLI